MRPPATCAACGQAFLKSERIAVLGSRIYHAACRKMVERGLANPIAEPTPNEDHWRRQVLDLELEKHKLKRAVDRGLVAVTAAENRLRDIRESKAALLHELARLEVKYHEIVATVAERRERIWNEARACQAIGRGVWGWARYLAVHEAAAGVDYTVERYRLLELD